MLAVEHDQPGAGAEAPASRASTSVAQRLGQPLALDAERHRRRLAAGHHEAVEAVEVARACAPRAPRRRARAASARARRSRPGGRGRRRDGARPALPAAVGEELVVVELARLERLPSPRRGPRTPWRRARRRRSASSPRRSRAARVAGSSDLKMPEPTNTASAPSCITSDASAGVAMPPAQNSGDRQPARARDLADEVERRLQLLGGDEQLGLVQRAQPADLAGDRAQVAHGLDDVAGARLALGADHRRALADAPQRLAEVRRAAHERHA